MSRLYSYKYRLHPTEEQEVLLNKHFGCVRFLYNHFLERRITSYHNDKKTLNYYDDATTIPVLKKDLPWLKEAGSQALQYSARALQNAYDNFFHKVKLKKQGKHKGRCGFPRFKSKRSRQSFKVMQNVRLIDNKLVIPKFLDGIPIVLHRPVEGNIEFATVSKNKAGQYFVSITVRKTIDTLPTIERVIGIDLNAKQIVGTDGDGYEKYNNPLPETKHEKTLKRLHKAVSRATKGSKGRRKAQLRYNKWKQHCHNVREDFQHKLTHKIIHENQVIVLEDLAMNEMFENKDPERRTEFRWKEKNRHRLLKDACFSSFVQKLMYKALWYGREVIRIDRWFPSSQICHCCGWRFRDLGEEREWTCYQCFETHDRDENASINIRNEGIRTSGIEGIANCLGVRLALNGEHPIGFEAPPSLAAG